MKLTGSLMVAAAAVIAIGLSPLPAAAFDVVTVPEPGTLSTFASAIVAGVIGYRWIRRR